MDRSDYYTEEEVRKLVKDFEDFTEWMYGQAGPIINGEFCYFSWDVERYLRNGQTISSSKDSSALS